MISVTPLQRCAHIALGAPIVIRGYDSRLTESRPTLTAGTESPKHRRPGLRSEAVGVEGRGKPYARLPQYTSACRDSFLNYTGDVSRAAGLLCGYHPSDIG